jgi:hypothetical protein
VPGLQQALDLALDAGYAMGVSASAGCVRPVPQALGRADVCQELDERLAPAAR